MKTDTDIDMVEAEENTAAAEDLEKGVIGALNSPKVITKEICSSKDGLY